MVLGLDPGYEESSLVSWDGTRIGEHIRSVPNTAMLDFLSETRMWRHAKAILAIEQVESMGMAVGKTVFETVFWTGRFAQAFSGRVERLPRRIIKLHLCGQTRATDANIRQALIDRFGPSTEQAFGKKKTPGPLHGITSHKLAALAVALTWHDQHAKDGEPIRPGVTADF